MTDYALLVDGVFQEIRRYDSKPADLPHKLVTWHEVERRQDATDFTGLENGVWVIQTIDPATLPLPVPSFITPRQCRLVLMAQGLLGQVEAMIAAQDEATRITWEYALEFRRDDPLLNQLAVNLGLTDAEIDQFFIAAAEL